GELGTARVGSVLAAAVVVTGAATAATDAAPATAATRTADLDLGRGASGRDVVALQRALGIPADGAFGSQTKRAVKRFQRNRGISPTGHVGPPTTAALRLRPSSAPGTPVAGRTPSAGRANLSRVDVTVVQRGLGVAADGVLGPQTRAALKAYEAAHGLPADGLPDATVLAKLRADPAPAPAPAPATSAPEAGSSPVSAALSAVGVPYRSAGTTRAGFDCSGLMVWAFRRAGVSLPRTSYAQYGVGSGVSKSAIRAGDLVFFNTAGPGPSDVGLATSATTAVSATTHGVMDHAITSGYWGAHFVGARRV
ncbi:MAG: NlpC/P60 family protein, partial [Solirubrobacteraceae bacterium]